MTATRPLFGNPSRLNVAAVENLSLGCDMAAYLTGVQTVTLPHVAVCDVASGTTTALAGGNTPSISGSTLRVLVTPGDLTAGHLYRFTFTMTPSGTTNILACAVDVNVAY